MIASSLLFTSVAGMYTSANDENDTAFNNFSALPASGAQADYTDEMYYTYNELAAMSDEEFLELYPSLSESAPYFGDDSIPDETKFYNFYNQVPEFYEGDNYQNVSYAAYLQFIDGSAVPYLTFRVNRYTDLDNEIVPSELGYPDDWIIICYDGVLAEGSSFPVQFHEYRIEIPSDVISDFEEYIRVQASVSIMLNTIAENKYDIEFVGGLDEQFASYGSLISNIYGDANLNYEVDLGDAVLVLQNVANPDKYDLSAQGSYNADMDGNGLTALDALAIQKQILNINE